MWAVRGAVEFYANGQACGCHADADSAGYDRVAKIVECPSPPPPSASWLTPGRSFPARTWVRGVRDGFADQGRPRGVNARSGCIASHGYFRDVKRRYNFRKWGHGLSGASQSEPP